MDYSVSGELFEVTCALQTLLEELGGFPVPGITEFTLASHIKWGLRRLWRRFAVIG